jgi:hypothetical protein
VVIIENTGVNENNKKQAKADIYLLAKKLAEFIGDLDKKKNLNDE